MNLKLLVGFFALFVAPCSPLHALDCTKASTPVARLICATPELRSADEKMSVAYFKLLHETTDPDFHRALIRSQSRWIAARETGPQRYGAAESDTTDDRTVLLRMTNARLEFLQNGELIRRMNLQKRFISKDGGGAFAGYATVCNLVPPPYGSWSYDCWGTLQRQHNDRICSSVTMWASGHLTDYRMVRVLKGKTFELTASCSIGYASTTEPCPDRHSTSPDAHWNVTPEHSSAFNFEVEKDLWKFDPDVPEGYDEVNREWMDKCLFSKTYPPPNESRSD